MNIKESLKKLSFLGDYSSLAVPIILAAVAGLLFIPTILMQSKLKAEIEDESIRGNGKKVESFLMQKSLSARQCKREEEFQDAFAQDAERIELLAKQSSQREILRYKLFPAPPNEVSQYIYRDLGNKFRSGIEAMISGLNGRDCPTQVELNKHLKKPTISTPFGFAVSKSSEKLGETEEIIVDALCRDIAQSISVYVNPSDISGYDFWKEYDYPGRKNAIEDCWYWQLGYWIIEDAVSTVKKLNSNSRSVFTSPVKRITSISFATDEDNRPTIPRMQSKSSGRRPSYVVSLTEGLALPLTGRKCDGDIDVVHFKIVVLLNARAVPDFSRELCSVKEHKFKGFSEDEEERTFQHNQITILKSSYVAISPDDEEHKLYRYGEDPVVKLELICEYIFNKKGYEAVKPEPVKQMLSELIPDTTAGSGA